MAEDIAISVNDVSKMYKLYESHGPSQGVPGIIQKKEI